ncbi:hypothetical protein QUF70_11945 [Desulfobacterales bacterium HSG17]|nr:hypothetical protein [Desulfobacterales bacterium HSG17]
MEIAINLPDEFLREAEVKSRIFRRSIKQQIEYWAKIGQLAEENPEIPLPFIQDMLTGREQIKAGIGTPYVFGEGE